MRDTTSTIAPTGLTVRMAGQGDAASLAYLAAVDSAAVPQGPTLLAEIDGEPAAALPLDGGAPVADPFRRTSAAVEVLELRAAQIRGGDRSPSYGDRLRALASAPRAAVR